MELDEIIEDDKAQVLHPTVPPDANPGDSTRRPLGDTQTAFLCLTTPQGVDIARPNRWIPVILEPSTCGLELR